MSGSRAITIGSFDGVHLGHAELIKAARSAVGQKGTVIALSFDPHPLCVLRPNAAPKRLSSLDQRREWLTQAGADEVAALRPTNEFLNQSPETFVTWVVKQYTPGVVVEGADFRFGRGRAGSTATLQKLQKSHGYRAVIIDAVQAALSDHTMAEVSSTLIRWLVSHGRIRDAALMLGRPYEVFGEVVQGDRRGGGTLGVPTANIDHGEYLLPAEAIYSGNAIGPDGREYRAAISVGTKPTFGENPCVCEVHLIGYQGKLDDYGWTIRLQFHDWMRDQIAYRRAESLVDQLHRDIESIQEAGVRSQGL